MSKENEVKIYALKGTNGSSLWERIINININDIKIKFVGDINADAIPDFLLIVNNYDYYAISGKNGQIIWQKGNLKVLSINDYNGDGVKDLLLDKIESGNYFLYTILNGKTGNILTEFKIYKSLPDETHTVYYDVGDLDGEGGMDLVFVRRIFDNWTKVIAFNGGTSIKLWENDYKMNSAYDWLYAYIIGGSGDLNGDSKKDLMLYISYYQHGYPTSWYGKKNNCNKR